MSKLHNIFLFGFLSFSLFGCVSTYSIYEPKKRIQNPTEYTFAFSAEQLAEKLEYIFSLQNQVNNQIPLSVSGPNSRFIADFKKLNAKSFEVMFNNSGVNFWQSDFYLVQGKPAKTTGKFKLTLNETSQSHTKVTAEVFDLEVINGVECCGPHGRYSRYTSVASTTIEEYALLYFIGEQLGLKMQPIFRPNTKYIHRVQVE